METPNTTYTTTTTNDLNVFELFDTIVMGSVTPPTLESFPEKTQYHLITTF